MDIDEKNRTIFTKGSPWLLYDFGRTEDFQGIKITCKYGHENVSYKIFMFGRGFYFNVREFEKITNSTGIEGLSDSFREIRRDTIFKVIEDNDAYFIFRRALQEAQKEDRRIIQSNEMENL